MLFWAFWLAQLSVADSITVEQTKIGIMVAAVTGVLNVIAMAFNAWYTKRSNERIELAKIAAESAERIAKINAENIQFNSKVMQQNTISAQRAHSELASKIEEVASTIQQNGN